MLWVFGLLALFATFMGYACCVAAGRADDYEEAQLKRESGNAS